MYSNNRYEVEVKYTTFIDVHSRGSLPRIELSELARYLNMSNPLARRVLGWTLLAYKWVANRITDSGPLLYLESSVRHLSKAERYGHPHERPIHSSKITPHQFEEVCSSYFFHGLNGAKAKKGWTWSEFHRKIVVRVKKKLTARGAKAEAHRHTQCGI